MNTTERVTVISTLLVLLLGMESFFPKAEVIKAKYLSKNVFISIKGTFSLHDWELKSSEGISEAVFEIDPDNKIKSISALSFTVPARSLKSGHNQMDKNTYKALKTKDHANIGFVLTKAAVIQNDAGDYQLKCSGRLTIAGTTNETELLSNGKWNEADNSLIISGTKDMKMTDYNIKPPTVMMGTIKTGDDISIMYNLKFSK